MRGEEGERERGGGWQTDPYLVEIEIKDLGIENVVITTTISEG